MRSPFPEDAPEAPPLAPVRVEEGRVHVLARRGGAEAAADLGLLHQHLVEAERTRIEGPGGAGEPDAVDAVVLLPHEPPDAVRVGLQPLEPVPAGAGVVE